MPVVQEWTHCLSKPDPSSWFLLTEGALPVTRVDLRVILSYFISIMFKSEVEKMAAHWGVPWLRARPTEAASCNPHGSVMRSLHRGRRGALSLQARSWCSQGHHALRWWAIILGQSQGLFPGVSGRQLGLGLCDPHCDSRWLLSVILNNLVVTWGRDFCLWLVSPAGRSKGCLQ